MFLERANLYINTLYLNTGLKQKDYLATTEIDHYSPIVDEDVSRMLGIMVRLARPQKILEIGTSIGYSTVSMAIACAEYGGTILTIDNDEEVVKHAIENFKRLGIAGNIEVRIGDAEEIVPGLQESFDLMFQDVGDKSLYAVLLDDCTRFLKPGSLLVAEDTLFPVMNDEGPGGVIPELEQGDNPENNGEQDQGVDIDGNPFANSIDDFSDKLARSPFFESTILPLGDGLTISIKRET